MGSAEVDDDVTPPEIDVVLPDADPVLRARGYRLHVFKDGAALLIADERVHPEQVSNPHAQAILESKRLWVHPTSMGWLRDQLETVLGKQRVPLTELQAESALEATQAMTAREYIVPLGDADGTSLNYEGHFPGCARNGCAATRCFEHRLVIDDAIARGHWVNDNAPYVRRLRGLPE